MHSTYWSDRWHEACEGEPEERMDESVKDAETACEELETLAMLMERAVRERDARELSELVNQARQKLQVLYAVAAIWESSDVPRVLR